MAIDREAIYAALLERFRDKVSASYFTRRDLTSEELTSSAKQPALVLRVTGYSPENNEGCAPIWTLGAAVILYARNSTKDGTTDAALNDLVGQVEAALELQPGEGGEYQTTLGGLVHRAWISGEVELLQGEVSDQAAAIVPVEMLAS